ncbi:MAG TPA: Ig-like domain-containing protein, partial [Chryseolinea sp.]|nr:Ig-like domain-containing protein [Chryseolinea sp.]
GNIYKTTVDFGEPLFDEFMAGFSKTNYDYNNNEILAQQVFQNGNMQFLAQWPNVSSPENLLERSSMRGRQNTSTFSQNQITDGGLGALGANLNGGKVWINGWFLTYTRDINSHSGNTINYNTADGQISFYKFYRVFGVLGLLDAEKEWFWDDASNTLYLYQAGGGSPSNVEFKQRNWGFDLRGKANTTIRGLAFIGCDAAVTNTSSTNTVIDNIRSNYANHTVLESKGGQDGYWNSAVQTGLKLFGANSVVRNSEFRYAAAMSIWAGSNTTIENNYFYNGDYCGQYSAFVKPAWNASNIKIMHNTMTRSGRAGIDVVKGGGSSNLNIEAGYNDISKFIMLNVDGGAIYGAEGNNLTGSNFHHNWFHLDGGYDEAGAGQQAGIHVNGIYLDQASGPITAHRNVSWNGLSGGGHSGSFCADFYNQIDYGGRNAGPSNIYNNTFATPNSGPGYSYVTYNTSPNDVQKNNIYRAGVVINWGASAGNIANSLLSGTAPQFDGTGALGLAYRLKAGSPGINAGVAITGFTDGSVGNPDAGAYEFGGPDWKAGYEPVAQAIPPANSPPAVSITAPAANASIVAGTAINITANATDANGTIARVEFYNGNTKIGEDLTGPYAFSWTGAAAGTHTLTARATDNQGATTTSSPVTITVTATTNKIPTVVLTAPATNSTSIQGSTVNITATATDSDGTIAKVEFFDGATKLGEDTSNPYTYSWANPAAGSHALTARATDDKGGVANSTAVTITVTTPAGNRPPVVVITSPANSSSVAHGTPITLTATATDSDGTIAKVEFFDGTKKLGEDTASPYTFSWTNATLGAHVITAKATDNSGLVATSAIVNITLTGSVVEPGNDAPTVSITSPAALAGFDISEEIELTASASDGNGTIAQVEFFEGTNKIGESTETPYSTTWTPPGAGSYSITAVATDNQGAKTVSNAVQIIIHETDTETGATDIYAGIPRYFSPNGDGNGDTWNWSDDPRLANASVEIRNRAGEVVYETNTYDNSWDGRSEGKALQDGEYYYIARLTNLTVLRASFRIIR